jgi:hypothetical protein
MSTDKKDNQDETNTGTGTTTTTATGTDAEAEVQEIKYPVITTSDEPDGSVKTTTEDQDHTITWVKKYPDGKTISLHDSGYEVTRHPNGDLEYMARNGMHIFIKSGNGEDVEAARRMLGGGGVNDKAFLRAIMSQLIKFDGKFIPPELFPKKFKSMDYLMLMSYYSEVNF